MTWKRGERKYDLGPKPVLKKRAADEADYSDDSYESAILGMEAKLRRKTPKITPQEILDGWRKEYGPRLARGAVGLLDAQDEGKGAATYHYRNAIFVDWCLAVSLHPLHARTREVREFVAWRQGTPLRARTIKHEPGWAPPRGQNKGPDPEGRTPADGTIIGYLCAMTHLYDYVVDELGLMLRNPARPVLIEWKERVNKNPALKRRAPETDELCSILGGAVSLRDFASIALDAGMGARNTEFRLIKDSDVYLDERWIRLTPIPGGKRVGPRWDRLQDAPKPIPNSYWLPISKEIAWIIEKWLDQKPTLARYRHSPYLCPPQTGVATSLRDAPPISLKGTNDLLRAAVRRSDVEVNWADARDHIVWHSLRHWYVTTLENATAGSDGRSRLQDIIDALRGDSVRTKRSANTYRHFTPDQLRDFIDRYFPTLGLKAIYEGSVRRVSETTHISDVIRGRARYGRGGVTY